MDDSVLYLGLDAGSTTVKLALVDAAGELLEARSVLPCMPGEARAVVSAVRDAIVPEGGWCRAWREAEL